MNRQGPALFEAPLAHEAVHYTNPYTGLEYYGASASESEWEQPGSICPAAKPKPITISKFSRYQQSIATLPPEERVKIDQIADMVVQSFMPGCFPITRITMVGHADKDVPRRPKFELDISNARVIAVKNALNVAINRRRKGLTRNITLVSGGVGARDPAVPNASAMSQRALNRRVVVFLEPSTNPVPLLFKWSDAAKRGLGLLEKSTIHPVQKKRLTCLLQKVLEPGVVDAFVVYDYVVRQQVAPLPAEQLMKFLYHLKVELGKRDSFGPTVPDSLFMDNLIQVDVSIRFAIEALDDRVHRPAPDRFKKQLWMWIGDRQKDPKSIYWCYGKGEQ